MDTLIFSILNALVTFLKIYTILLTVRVYLTWFPNLNLFHRPWSILGTATNPYLRLFRGLVPNVLGFDLSPVLGFLFISAVIDLLESLTGVG
jgi:YggT family protein